MSTIVLRVISKAGRSRIEIPQTASYSDLKTELSSRLSVDPRSLQIFADEKYTKKIAAPDTANLAQLNLKNGDMIYIANQDTVMAAVVAS